MAKVRVKLEVQLGNHPEMMVYYHVCPYMNDPVPLGCHIVVSHHPTEPGGRLWVVDGPKGLKELKRFHINHEGHVPDLLVCDPLYFQEGYGGPQEEPVV